MASNFFEHFGLDKSFYLDEKLLKKKYYKLSRTLHPDFNDTDNEASQNVSLDQTSFNNLAYKTLSKFDSRLKYILELDGLISKDIKHELPQAFLMDMMDINEGLMELQFYFSETDYQKILQQIEDFKSELRQSVDLIFENNSFDQMDKVLDYYLKNKYLLRIQENLNKLAPGLE